MKHLQIPKAVLVMIAIFACALAAAQGHPKATGTATFAFTNISNTVATVVFDAHQVDNGVGGYGHFAYSATGTWTHDFGGSVSNVHINTVTGTATFDVLVEYSIGYEQFLGHTITITVKDNGAPGRWTTPDTFAYAWDSLGGSNGPFNLTSGNITVHNK